jgi:hypothetical protein
MEGKSFPILQLCSSSIFLTITAGMQAVGAAMPDGLKKKIVGWAKRTMLT